MANRGFETNNNRVCGTYGLEATRAVLTLYSTFGPTAVARGLRYLTLPRLGFR